MFLINSGGRYIFPISIHPTVKNTEQIGRTIATHLR